MASKSAQLEHLQNLPLFQGCTKKELTAVHKAGDEITMADGTVIIDQGQLGREAFVILDGNVVVKRRDRKIATLGPGDMVGELALLDHGPRTASAICDGDCTLFVLDQRHFRGVLEDHPAITMKVLAVLAHRIRELDRQYYG